MKRLLLLSAVALFLTACSSFGFRNTVGHSFPIQVINQITNAGEAGVSLRLTAYYTGTGPETILVQEEAVTDASGQATFDLTYTEKEAEDLRESVGATTEEPLYRLEINTGYATLKILESGGQEIPIVNNRPLTGGESFTFEVVPTTVITLDMIDSINPTLVDETLIIIREINPVKDTLINRLSGPYNNTGIRSTPVVAGRDTEIRWIVREGPDPASLAFAFESRDTVNVPAGSTLTVPIVH